jgi:uncharacterized protein YcaQ
MPAPTLATLRRYAVARSLFAPTDLRRAIAKLGFVQADPIRAPARAQDLVLRHRVRNYHAGDLERRYAELGIEEDYFVNYGFITRAQQALMHPRKARHAWTAATRRRASHVLAFVQQHGTVHPRQVDEHFAHGTVANAWGGGSNATTQLLDGMHYRGMLRVVRRQAGTRIYAARDVGAGAVPALAPAAALDALVDMIVQKYAPLTATGLWSLVRRLALGAPQLSRGLPAAFERATQRLARARVAGRDWYWPAHESPHAFRDAVDGEVRLLAPFDPIVWDRPRFELLWGWAYRFEAYAPAGKRKLGYYALPVLYREHVLGWANVAVADGVLSSVIGYPDNAPASRDFARGLDAELQRMRAFLRLPAETTR